LPEGRGCWEGGCENVLLLLFFHGLCVLLTQAGGDGVDPVTRNTGAQALTMAMKLCVAVLFGGKLKFANWAFLGAL
jgi:hypothetical protein